MLFFYFFLREQYFQIAEVHLIGWVYLDSKLYIKVYIFVVLPYAEGSEWHWGKKKIIKLKLWLRALHKCFDQFYQEASKPKRTEEIVTYLLAMIRLQIPRDNSMAVSPKTFFYV